MFLWSADVYSSPFCRLQLFPFVSLCCHHSGILGKRRVNVYIYSAILYIEARTQFQKYRDLMGKKNLNFTLLIEVLEIII